MCAETKVKPKVAFFDFTSCEGCQLNKLNLENDLLDILQHIDIVEFREAMDDKANEYDIAFIEGSISTPSCVERIHDIRRRSKMLIALGACATQGGINAMKNLQPIEEVREAVYGDEKYRFPTLPAMPVSAIVKVDYEIDGCPMSMPEFLKVLKSLLAGQDHCLLKWGREKSTCRMTVMMLRKQHLRDVFEGLVMLLEFFEQHILLKQFFSQPYRH